MSDFQERLEIRNDLLMGKIPKRVPVYPSVTFECACSLAGIDLIKAHYDMELREKAYTASCETFYADSLPAGDVRYPPVYQLFGARHWIVGSNGAMQHPEMEAMRADEYDKLIENPYNFIVDELLPRVSTAPNITLALAKAYEKYKEIRKQNMQIIIKLSKKYGKTPGMITAGQIDAPFDFIADLLRGFKGITMDVRRCPDKIEKAVEAVTPLMLKLGLPPNFRQGDIHLMPLHLAPYINMKTFERLYWPSLEKVVTELDKVGAACYLFAEEDWTRYSEFLERLPKSSIIGFEKGDYKKIKQTVGKNHVIAGFFDPTITLTRSKEQCIDEAKRLVDTCAPGGRYAFSFGTALMDIKSIDVSKLQAVLEWVHVNAVY